MTLKGWNANEQQKDNSRAGHTSHLAQIVLFLKGQYENKWHYNHFQYPHYHQHCYYLGDAITVYGEKCIL